MVPTALLSLAAASGTLRARKDDRPAAAAPVPRALTGLSSDDRLYHRQEAAAATESTAEPPQPTKTTQKSPKGTPSSPQVAAPPRRSLAGARPPQVRLSAREASDLDEWMASTVRLVAVVWMKLAHLLRAQGGVVLVSRKYRCFITETFALQRVASLCPHLVSVWWRLKEAAPIRTEHEEAFRQRVYEQVLWEARVRNVTGAAAPQPGHDGKGRGAEAVAEGEERGDVNVTVAPTPEAQDAMLLGSLTRRRCLANAALCGLLLFPVPWLGVYRQQEPLPSSSSSSVASSSSPFSVGSPRPPNGFIDAVAVRPSWTSLSWYTDGQAKELWLALGNALVADDGADAGAVQKGASEKLEVDSSFVASHPAVGIVVAPFWQSADEDGPTDGAGPLVSEGAKQSQAQPACEADASPGATGSSNTVSKAVLRFKGAINKRANNSTVSSSLVSSSHAVEPASPAVQVTPMAGGGGGGGVAANQSGGEPPLPSALVMITPSACLRLGGETTFAATLDSELRVMAANHEAAEAQRHFAAANRRGVMADPVINGTGGSVTWGMESSSSSIMAAATSSSVIRDHSSVFSANDAVAPAVAEGGVDHVTTIGGGGRGVDGWQPPTALPSLETGNWASAASPHVESTAPEQIIFDAQQRAAAELQRSLLQQLAVRRKVVAMNPFAAVAGAGTAASAVASAVPPLVQVERLMHPAAASGAPVPATTGAATSTAASLLTVPSLWFSLGEWLMQTEKRQLQSWLQSTPRGIVFAENRVDPPPSASKGQQVASRLLQLLPAYVDRALTQCIATVDLAPEYLSTAADATVFKGRVGAPEVFAMSISYFAALPSLDASLEGGGGGFAKWWLREEYLEGHEAPSKIHPSSNGGETPLLHVIIDAVRGHENNQTMKRRKEHTYDDSSSTSSSNSDDNDDVVASPTIVSTQPQPRSPFDNWLWTNKGKRFVAQRRFRGRVAPAQVWMRLAHALAHKAIVLRTILDHLTAGAMDDAGALFAGAAEELDAVSVEADVAGLLALRDSGGKSCSITASFPHVDIPLPPQIHPVDAVIAAACDDGDIQVAMPPPPVPAAARGACVDAAAIPTRGTTVGRSNEGSMAAAATTWVSREVASKIPILLHQKYGLSQPARQADRGGGNDTSATQTRVPPVAGSALATPSSVRSKTDAEGSPQNHGGKNDEDEWQRGHYYTATLIGTGSIPVTIRRGAALTAKEVSLIAVAMEEYETRLRLRAPLGVVLPLAQSLGTAGDPLAFAGSSPSAAFNNNVVVHPRDVQAHIKQYSKPLPDEDRALIWLQLGVAIHHAPLPLEQDVSHRGCVVAAQFHGEDVIDRNSLNSPSRPTIHLHSRFQFAPFPVASRKCRGGPLLLVLAVDECIQSWSARRKLRRIKRHVAAAARANPFASVEGLRQGPPAPFPSVNPAMVSGGPSPQGVKGPSSSSWPAHASVYGQQQPRSSSGFQTETTTRPGGRVVPVTESILAALRANVVVPSNFVLPALTCFANACLLWPESFAGWMSLALLLRTRRSHVLTLLHTSSSSDSTMDTRQPPPPPPTLTVNALVCAAQCARLEPGNEAAWRLLSVAVIQWQLLPKEQGVIHELEEEEESPSSVKTPGINVGGVSAVPPSSASSSSSASQSFQHWLPQLRRMTPGQPRWLNLVRVQKEEAIADDLAVTLLESLELVSYFNDDDGDAPISSFDDHGTRRRSKLLASTAVDEDVFSLSRRHPRLPPERVGRRDQHHNAPRRLIDEDRCVACTLERWGNVLSKHEARQRTELCFVSATPTPVEAADFLSVGSVLLLVLVGAARLHGHLDHEAEADEEKRNDDKDAMSGVGRTSASRPSIYRLEDGDIITASCRDVLEELDGLRRLMVDQFLLATTRTASERRSSTPTTVSEPPWCHPIVGRRATDAARLNVERWQRVALGTWSFVFASAAGVLLEAHLLHARFPSLRFEDGRHSSLSSGSDGESSAGRGSSWFPSARQCLVRSLELDPTVRNADAWLLLSSCMTLQPDALFFVCHPLRRDDRDEGGGVSMFSSGRHEHLRIRGVGVSVSLAAATLQAIRADPTSPLAWRNAARLVGPSDGAFSDQDSFVQLLRHQQSATAESKVGAFFNSGVNDVLRSGGDRRSLHAQLTRHWLLLAPPAGKQHDERGGEISARDTAGSALMASPSSTAASWGPLRGIDLAPSAFRGKLGVDEDRVASSEAALVRLACFSKSDCAWLALWQQPDDAFGWLFLASCLTRGPAVQPSNGASRQLVTRLPGVSALECVKAAVLMLSADIHRDAARFQATVRGRQSAAAALLAANNGVGNHPVARPLPVFRSVTALTATSASDWCRWEGKYRQMSSLWSYLALVIGSGEPLNVTSIFKSSTKEEKSRSRTEPHAVRGAPATTTHSLRYHPSDGRYQRDCAVLAFRSTGAAKESLRPRSTTTMAAALPPDQPGNDDDDEGSDGNGNWQRRRENTLPYRRVEEEIPNATQLVDEAVHNDCHLLAQRLYDEHYLGRETGAHFDPLVRCFSLGDVERLLAVIQPSTWVAMSTTVLFSPMGKGGADDDHDDDDEPTGGGRRRDESAAAPTKAASRGGVVSDTQQQQGDRRIRRSTDGAPSMRDWLPAFRVHVDIFVWDSFRQGPAAVKPHIGVGHDEHGPKGRKRHVGGGVGPGNGRMDAEGGRWVTRRVPLGRLTAVEAIERFLASSRDSVSGRREAGGGGEGGIRSLGRSPFEANQLGVVWERQGAFWYLTGMALWQVERLVAAMATSHSLRGRGLAARDGLLNVAGVRPRAHISSSSETDPETWTNDQRISSQRRHDDHGDQRQRWPRFDTAVEFVESELQDVATRDLQRHQDVHDEHLQRLRDQYNADDATGRPAKVGGRTTNSHTSKEGDALQVGARTASSSSASPTTGAAPPQDFNEIVGRSKHPSQAAPQPTSAAEVKLETTDARQQRVQNERIAADVADVLRYDAAPPRRYDERGSVAGSTTRAPLLGTVASAMSQDWPALSSGARNDERVAAGDLFSTLLGVNLGRKYGQLDGFTAFLSVPSAVLRSVKSMSNSLGCVRVNAAMCFEEVLRCHDGHRFDAWLQLAQLCPVDGQSVTFRGTPADEATAAASGGIRDAPQFTRVGCLVGELERLGGAASAMVSGARGAVAWQSLAEHVAYLGAINEEVRRARTRSAKAQKAAAVARAEAKRQHRIELGILETTTTSRGGEEGEGGEATSDDSGDDNDDRNPSAPQKTMFPGVTRFRRPEVRAAPDRKAGGPRQTPPSAPLVSRSVFLTAATDYVVDISRRPCNARFCYLQGIVCLLNTPPVRSCVVVSSSVPAARTPTTGAGWSAALLSTVSDESARSLLSSALVGFALTFDCRCDHQELLRRSQSRALVDGGSSRQNNAQRSAAAVLESPPTLRVGLMATAESGGPGGKIQGASVGSCSATTFHLASRQDYLIAALNLNERNAPGWVALAAGMTAGESVVIGSRSLSFAEVNNRLEEWLRAEQQLWLTRPGGVADASHGRPADGAAEMRRFPLGGPLFWLAKGLLPHSVAFATQFHRLQLDEHRRQQLRSMGKPTHPAAASLETPEDVARRIYQAKRQNAVASGDTGGRGHATGASHYLSQDTLDEADAIGRRVVSLLIEGGGATQQSPSWGSLPLWRQRQADIVREYRRIQRDPHRLADVGADGAATQAADSDESAPSVDAEIVALLQAGDGESTLDAARRSLLHDELSRLIVQTPGKEVQDGKSLWDDPPGAAI